MKTILRILICGAVFYLAICFARLDWYWIPDVDTVARTGFLMGWALLVFLSNPEYDYRRTRK